MAPRHTGATRNPVRPRSTSSIRALPPELLAAELERLGQVTRQIAGEVGEHVPVVEPPAPVDTAELVVVPTGDDRGHAVGRLVHAEEVGLARRGVAVDVEL